MSQPRKAWYVFFRGSEFGPLGGSELTQVLRSGKIGGRLHAWRPGLAAWIPIGSEQVGTERLEANLERLVQRHEESRRDRTGSTREIFHGEARAARRTRFPAVVFAASGSNSKRLLGTCDDISRTGLRVLTDGREALGDGVEIRLQVIPASATGLPSFEVVATVVRVRDGSVAFKIGSFEGGTSEQVASFVECPRGFNQMGEL